MSNNDFSQPAPPNAQPTPPAYGQPAPPPYGGTPGYGAAPAYGSAPTYGGPAYGAYAAAKTNTLAIVSLIASIAGLTVVPFIGSIVGVITGHMSLGQIKRTGEGGRGIGLAGTIIGWVGLALAVLGTIIVLAMIPWFLVNAQELSNA